MKSRNLPIYAITALSLLLLVVGCQKPEPLTVTVLHWNDFHAHNLPFTTVFRDDTVKVGGIAHLAALLDSLKEIEPRALTLHAGDEFTGSPICALTHGKSQIELLNLVAPDA
jgi:2',3'-cyclic-nucleotide 2'-phosphodiesterase (5'-nucleotidase family)